MLKITLMNQHAIQIHCEPAKLKKKKFGNMAVQNDDCRQNKMSAMALFSQPSSCLTSIQSTVSVASQLNKKKKRIFFTHIHSYSLPLPQSMTSVQVAKICVMRMPSAPTPSEDTCVPASQAMWAMAPSVGVSSWPGTAFDPHKDPNPFCTSECNLLCPSWRHGLVL